MESHSVRPAAKEMQTTSEASKDNCECELPPHVCKVVLVNDRLVDIWNGLATGHNEVQFKQISVTSQAEHHTVAMLHVPSIALTYQPGTAILDGAVRLILFGVPFNHEVSHEHNDGDAALVVSVGQKERGDHNTILAAAAKRPIFQTDFLIRSGAIFTDGFLITSLQDELLELSPFLRNLPQDEPR